MRLENFTEVLKPGRVTDYGAFSFAFNEVEERSETPHWEMKECLDMFEDIPMINSGVDQLVTFIFGKGIRITSGNKDTEKYLSEWMNQRKEFDAETKKFISRTIVTGNGYLETPLVGHMSGRKIIDNAFNVDDPSRVFLNLDAIDDPEKIDEYWIYQVPLRTGTYQGRTPNYFKFTYYAGDVTYLNQIYGVPIHKDELRHLKFGVSRDGIYGRSFLGSVIDDADALKRIIRNFSLIAQYKAIGRKIISIGSEAMPADIDDIKKLELDLDQTGTVENLIVNKPIQMQDMSFTGQYDSMSNELDFLRKSISSGIIPNFLTPWNSEVNRATSEDVKVMFQLQLESLRKRFSQFLKYELFVPISQAAGKSTEFEVEFLAVDLYSLEKKMSQGLQLYQNNVVTLNELRERFLNMNTVPNEDKVKAQIDIDKGFPGTKAQEIPIAKPGTEPEEQGNQNNE